MQNLNTHTISRLSSYKKALVRLNSLGFQKVFSDNLGDAVGVKASQVRKDFSLLDIKGNKRGGYILSDLLEVINNILGKQIVEKVVLVGVGQLGSALLSYKGFENENIKIVAGFDLILPSAKPTHSIPIYEINKLSEYIKKNNIKMGIIAVPGYAAQQTLNLMLKSGIKGILNFAGIQLKSTSNCVIKNIDIALELENLIYLTRSLEKT